jgi:hypothetical protein
MIITLKRPANCRDCGAQLAAGERANWYRNGAVYGLTCHTHRASSGRREEPMGLKLSRLDRTGFYSHDGRLLGRVRCGHEDYPCCGC